MRGRATPGFALQPVVQASTHRKTLHRYLPELNVCLSITTKGVHGCRMPRTTKESWHRAMKSPEGKMLEFRDAKLRN
jgi:hypothetical protein